MKGERERFPFSIMDERSYTMGEQWIAVLSEFGFPVVVTFYLMHRIEGKLDMLNSSIHSLAEQLKAKS